MGGYLNCFVAAPGPLEGCQNCLNVAIAPVARLQSCDAATGPVVGHLSRYVAVSLPLDPWQVARTIFCPLGLWLVSSFFWGGGLLGSDSFCFGGVVFLDLRPGPHTTHPGLVVLYIFLLVLGLQEPALRGGYCQEPGPDDPGPMGSFGLVGV